MPESGGDWLSKRGGASATQLCLCVSRRGCVCNLYFVGICRRVRMKYKLQLYSLNSVLPFLFGLPMSAMCSSYVSVAIRVTLSHRHKRIQ